MRCPKCSHEYDRTDLMNLQQSKEDYWLCKCGDFHKGFPYECKRREYQNVLLKYQRDTEISIGHYFEEAISLLEDNKISDIADNEQEYLINLYKGLLGRLNL